MSLKNVNVKDGAQRALRDDDGLGGRAATKWAVDDQTAHQKLDAIIGALGGSVDTTPQIFNIVVASANTEVSQVLPTNTKKFIIRTRNRSELKLAYVSGESSTNYVTIKKGAVFEDANLYLNQTIYFQVDNAGETVEILTYT